MVTKQFKSLAQKLNEDGPCIVVLTGPKGVGKTTSLCALAAVCKSPYILYSLQASRYFPSYFKSCFDIPIPDDAEFASEAESEQPGPSTKKRKIAIGEFLYFKATRLLDCAALMQLI